MKKKKTSAGFTLMEAVIALSIWMMLSLSVLVIWQYTTDRTTALIERQNAFENARITMDTLLINIQMARSIEVEVWRDYTLRRITLAQINPDGNPHNYSFFFDVSARRTDTWYSMLQIGYFRPSNPNNRQGRNEVSRGIAHIRVEPVNGRRMYITVKTSCENPIVLNGSVDIRYKGLNVVRR